VPDGFEQVGLVKGCRINDTSELADHAVEAPGLKGQAPDDVALTALVAEGGNITSAFLEAVVPRWDI
jgi:hypothetical protein